MKATCGSCGESRELSSEAITSPDFDFACPRCQTIMVLEQDAEPEGPRDAGRAEASTKVDTESESPLDFDAYSYAARQLGLPADTPPVEGDPEGAMRPSARLVPGIPVQAPPLPRWDGGDTQTIQELAKSSPELLASEPTDDDGDDEGEGSEDPLGDITVVEARITAGTGSRTFDRPLVEADLEEDEAEEEEDAEPERPPEPPVAREAPREAAPSASSSGPGAPSSSVSLAKKVTDEIPIPKIEEEDADLAEPPKQAAAPRSARESDWYDLLDEVLTEAPAPAPVDTEGSTRKVIQITKSMSAADAELVRELKAKLESVGDPTADLLEAAAPGRPSSGPIATPEAPAKNDKAATQKVANLPTPTSRSDRNAATQKVAEVAPPPERSDRGAATQELEVLPTPRELPATQKEPPQPPRPERPPAAPAPPPAAAEPPAPRPAQPPTEKEPPPRQGAVARRPTGPRPAAASGPVRSKKIAPRRAAESQRIQRSDVAPLSESGRHAEAPETRPAPAPRPAALAGPRELDARGGFVGAFQRESLDPAFVTARDPASDAAERFRELFHQVFPHRRDAPQVVLVTSVFPGEGRTTVATNLAVAAAATPGRGGLLVGADPHGRPILDYFGLRTQAPGLLEALESAKDPRGFIMRFALGMLHVLPVGHGGEIATALLAGDAMGAFLTKLRRVCPPATAIVLDGPSLQTDTALSLARLADGVVLVVRPGETPVDAAVEARAKLGNARVLGVVLNDVPRRALGPRSAERGNLNDLRQGIEQALGNLDATCAELASLRDAAEQARESAAESARAASSAFEKGLASLERTLEKTFKEELRRVRQSLGASGAAAGGGATPSAKAALSKEIDKAKKAASALEEQKRSLSQAQEQLSKEKSDLVAARRALEAELERQARGGPPAAPAAGPGPEQLLAIQAALEEVRALALSERARAQDAEEQVKRLTARCNDLTFRERSLRRQMGLENAAAEAGVAPPEAEPQQMKMTQRPTDPRATVRPEYRSGERPRPPSESQRVRVLGSGEDATDSQRLIRSPADSQRTRRPSETGAGPQPSDSQNLRTLSSERLRALVDEARANAAAAAARPNETSGPRPRNGMDTRSGPRPSDSRSSERLRPS